MEKSEGEWSVHPTYAQIRAVLDTLNAGLLLRTVEGRVLFANDRLLQWLDYTAQELDGRDVRTLIADDLLDSAEEEFREIHSGDERLRIGVLKRKSGRTLPVVFCPHLLKNGEETIAVVSLVMDLGEVQTAHRVGATPEDAREGGLAGALQRIAGELQTISLFAGAPSIAGISPDHPDLTSLSPREREILGELVGGLRVPAIAQKLFISPHTVRNHLKSIYRKLDVSDQNALIERIRGIGPGEVRRD